MANFAVPNLIADTGLGENTLPKINAKRGHVAIANRNSGDLSILHEQTGAVKGHVALPTGPNGEAGEPTYLSFLNRTDEVAVADRANDRVVFYDQRTYEVTGTVDTGAGNFHMWAAPKETQLWVINDIDEALTVIDPQTKTEITRIHLPEELIGADAKPHDLIFDPAGQYVYVTAEQEDHLDDDLLLKIDTQSFEVVDAITTGKHTHVSVAPEHNLLYVLSQDNDTIEIYDHRGLELEQVGHIDQPNPHGVSAATNGRYLYTTNISDGGEQGIFVIDTVTNQIVGDVDTPFAVPHNLAVTNDGNSLFLTHSGADATAVSRFSLDDPTDPVWQISVNTGGLNPFGLAYIPSVHDELYVCGDKDDVLKTAKGQDTVYGGAGKDKLWGQGGNDKLFGEADDDYLRGNRGDDVLIGGLGNDTVNGGSGDDLLIGAQVESLTPGAGEVDTYKGGKGADTFVLGDALSVHYDDGDPASLGFEDYGLLKDFTLDQQDVVRLHGSADRYELGSVQGDTFIFYQGEGQTAELVGIVQNVTGLNLNSAAFEYATV
ncbi:type I secretion target GGXGXDXXX repeat protein domain protein [Synechococcus sp. PCC 7335]|uniref:beta-propeller fold lactonase family protein n=1 Tax=Synechococcus sp. (strain ATCC 29403 / PCC 7335) TaxID=91464 RepID=UPI00017EC0CB|nr:beta-propeller fold lactonase family protein [Synechococcus sp. PCC 7335]EDX82672.1 type I secretion target GGXGXDXXX repeat protein domain protein [Synechococcus sp. PCC 7335]